MGQAAIKKKNGNYPAQKPRVVPFAKKRVEDDDDTLGRYDFRKIKSSELPHVVFNDGNLAFTISFVDPKTRNAGDGVLYSAATFRSMTDLTTEEFLQEYPVVHDAFWHDKMGKVNEKGKTGLQVFETLLREGWTQKLKGDVTSNDGDRAVRFMLLDNGEDGADLIQRSETALSKSAFLKLYPVTNPLPWPAKDFDSAIAEMTKQGLILPTYTRESTLELFKSGDSRITDNSFGTEKCIPLSTVRGYFMYSDDRGGIATFHRGDTHESVFRVTREITKELMAAKHDEPCTCDWRNFEYRCGCEQHHEGVTHDVLPMLEICDKVSCDGKHAHMYGFCQACFDADIAAGVDKAKATANAIHFQLR